MIRKWMLPLLLCAMVIAPLPALANYTPTIEYIELEVPREVSSFNKEATLIGPDPVEVFPVMELSPSGYAPGAPTTFPRGTVGEFVEYMSTNEFAAIKIGGRLYFVRWANVKLGEFVFHTYIDGTTTILVPILIQPECPPPQGQPEF